MVFVGSPPTYMRIVALAISAFQCSSPKPKQSLLSDGGGLVVNETCNLFSLLPSVPWYSAYHYGISFTYHWLHFRLKKASNTIWYDQSVQATKLWKFVFFISATKRKVNGIRIRSTWKERDFFSGGEKKARQQPLHYCSHIFSEAPQQMPFTTALIWNGATNYNK